MVEKTESRNHLMIPAFHKLTLSKFYTVTFQLSYNYFKFSGLRVLHGAARSKKGFPYINSFHSNLSYLRLNGRRTDFKAKC
jgi:hypothetical protein